MSRENEFNIGYSQLEILVVKSFDPRAVIKIMRYALVNVTHWLFQQSILSCNTLNNCCLFSHISIFSYISLKSFDPSELLYLRY